MNSFELKVYIVHMFLNLRRIFRAIYKTEFIITCSSEDDGNNMEGTVGINKHGMKGYLPYHVVNTVLRKRFASLKGHTLRTVSEQIGLPGTPDSMLFNSAAGLVMVCSQENI